MHYHASFLTSDTLAPSVPSETAATSHLQLGTMSCASNYPPLIRRPCTLSIQFPVIILDQPLYIMQSKKRLGLIQLYIFKLGQLFCVSDLDNIYFIAISVHGNHRVDIFSRFLLD